MPSEQVEAAISAYREANPRPVATVGMVADHLDHMRETAGIDHVGLGGDLDGATTLAERLGSADGYPWLIAELLDRGWSRGDIAKLTWQNAPRVLRDAEDVADSPATRERAVALSIPRPVD